MTSLSELRFFTTPAHDCSYLDGKQAITLFADPLAKVDKDLYSALSAVGFRRSGSHIYRPYCQACTACSPVRVPVSQFASKRKHRRVRKANESLTVTKHSPQLTEEYFLLYEKYISERHSDGDMYPASREQFQSFLVGFGAYLSDLHANFRVFLTSLLLAEVTNHGISFRDFRLGSLV